MAGDDYRLPRTVAPTRYQLHLEPDLDAATFTGLARIDLDVADDVLEITCNAIELEITEAQIETQEGRTSSATWTYDEALERVTFTFAEPVSIGEAVLHVRYQGILNDQLHGFYRSTFVDAEGQRRTIATTQFEATDARRAFPCWDEPDRKAVFEVTLTVPGDLAAYSNSPVVAERVLDDGRRELTYAPTMKMSTYLVAFVVGPFEATAPVDVDGVPLRVVYPVGKGHLATFALEIGAFALRYFSEYFAIAYPGDKLDLVAIPDFAFGAMENLGCVTFRETALLADPAQASRLSLERIVDVVAHEIAHMWFGDLVTMGWWEGIWLNEAFATFMEVSCTDAFRPEWQRWVSFGIEKEMAMAIDGLHTTRPIEYEVRSPDDANGMFDVLTYEKGGSVLRMLQQYLGEDAFRDGVRLYLQRHRYANAVTVDLWNAIEEASGQPVRQIMDTWILQGGHPIVTIDGGVVTQAPFAYGPKGDGAASAIGETWEVPVLARSLTSGATTKVLLGTSPVDLELGREAVLLNAGGSGVYRSAYAAADAAALVPRLAELSPLERANLLNDAWAATQAGQMDLEAFFALGGALGDDGEPSTWQSVIRALQMCSRIIDDENRAVLEAATVRLLGAKAAALGWEPVAGEDERTPNLRASLLGALGTLGGDRATIDAALSRFDATDPINPDLVQCVLEIVGDQGRAGDYDRVLEHHHHAPTPQLEVQYLQALAGFGTAELAERTFELCRSEVRTQDAPFVLGAAIANPATGAATWGRIAAHWEELLGRFPANAHSRMVSTVSTLYAHPTVASEAIAFLTAHPVATGQQSVKQSLERLANNLAFAERIRPTLVEVLRRVAS